MEKTAFKKKAKTIERLLDGRVTIGNSKENVMHYFCRYMDEVDGKEEYTGEQVAKLNRILLNTICSPRCESNKEQEERKERWRKEAEERSRFK